MKEVSLNRPAEKMGKETAVSAPRESYPSFSIYDKAPEELLKCEIGYETTAKIKLTSKEIRVGPNARKSVGFDVLSVTIDEGKAKKHMADMSVPEIMKIQREKRKNKD